MSTQVFLINLEKDRDRLAVMSDQLGMLSIPFERIDAVYGTKMPEWIRPYFLDADGRIASKLLPGEVGCYASHLLVLKRIADSGRPALVLEDDVEISPDFPSILNSISQLPQGWEIIRLSNPYKRSYVPVSRINSNYQAVKFTHVSPSTGAYLVTPEGARKFLDWKQLRSLPVDQDMRRVWDCKLVTYGIFPRPITPDVGTSSIDGMVQRKVRSYQKKKTVQDELARIAFDIQWLGVKAWALNLFYSKSAERPARTPVGRNVSATKH
ncbi:MAG: glycosyltransferase family 25 protein [Micropepsaceae bacterium]